MDADLDGQIQHVVDLLRADVACSQCDRIDPISYSTVCEHTLCSQCMNSQHVCPVCKTEWIGAIQPCPKMASMVRCIQRAMSIIGKDVADEDDGQLGYLTNLSRSPPLQMGDYSSYWVDTKQELDERCRELSQEEQILESVISRLEPEHGRLRPDQLAHSLIHDDPDHTDLEIARLRQDQQRLDASFDVLGLSQLTNAENNDSCGLNPDLETEPSQETYRSTLLIALSGFTEPERIELEAACRSLGGVIASTTAEMTHLVTAVDNNRRGKRTLKFMTAIVKGSWIVDRTWIDQSLNEGRWIMENPCEVVGDSSSITVEFAPRKGREWASKSKSLLDGMVFVLHGNIPDITELIMLGGGSILEESSLQYPPPKDTTRRRIILLCPHGFPIQQARALAARTGLDPVNFAWLFNCISSFAVLSINPYRMAGPSQ